MGKRLLEFVVLVAVLACAVRYLKPSTGPQDQAQTQAQPSASPKTPPKERPGYTERTNVFDPSTRLSIDGVWIGETDQELLAELGSPVSGSDATQAATWYYPLPGPGRTFEPSHAIQITLNAHRVCCVFGESLLQNGKILARQGDPLEPLLYILPVSLGSDTHQLSCQRIGLNIAGNPIKTVCLTAPLPNAQMQYQDVRPQPVPQGVDRVTELRYRAHAAMARFDFDSALNYCNEILAANPGDLGTYVDRGIVRSGLRDWAQAEADFTKALEDPQHFPQAQVLRGEARLRGGNLDGALTDLNESIQTNRLDATPLAMAFHFRGQALAQMGRYAQAAEDYERSLQIIPGDSGVQRELQEVRSHLGG
jgi:hypothetical protein